MNEFRADLHCHTTCSDGTLTPEEMIDLAIQTGLQGLSITDHDTIAAYDLLSEKLQKNGLEIIPGVEFSAVHREVSIHILAYAFPLGSAVIRRFSKQHFLRRQERNEAILSLLQRHKMPVDAIDLQKVCKGMPGRPHIAQAMIEKGYVVSIEEAFKKYLGEGKCCYYPGSRPSVEETLDVIRSAGALAVIAHPQLIKQRRIINQLLEMDFDGIEAYYARFSGYDEQKWVNIAREKGWIVTGGSDYHGEIKPQNPLGSSWVSEETFRILQDHYLSHHENIQ